MNTYKKRVLSPMQPIVVRKVQDKRHPLREVIEKCIGTHDIKVVVEEDIQTIAAMRREDLVAFIATLVRNDQVLSQGRGCSILNPSGRFLSRSVHSAFNSALADAAIRATKVLDTFRGNAEGSNANGQPNDSEPATDRQKSFLRELIQINLDEEERERWESQLNDLSKQEASKLIERFRR